MKVELELNTSDHVVGNRQRTGEGYGEIELPEFSDAGLGNQQQELLDVTGKCVRNDSEFAAQAAEGDKPATTETTREVLGSKEVLESNAPAMKNADV